MQRFRLTAVLAAMLLLAACSGATSGTGESPPNSNSDVPTETVGSAITSTPLDSVTAPEVAQPTAGDAPTETVVIAPTDAAPAELVLAPGQRSAPVAVDAGFHNDEARVVAASGRPQLIEMFTFW